MHTRSSLRHLPDPPALLSDVTLALAAVVLMTQAIATALGAWNTATVAVVTSTLELNPGSRPDCLLREPHGDVKSQEMQVPPCLLLDGWPSFFSLFFCFVLNVGLKFMALPLLSKYTTTEPHSNP